jgi:hypothetical protein
MTAAAIILAVAASASAKPGAGNGVRTIRLHTVVISATVNSAGNGGPGDVVAILFSVSTSTGESGHADISCTNFPNGEQLCHAAFVLPDGQIDAQAAIRLTATTFMAAVIGGTGAYEGATGEIVNVRGALGVVDRTIHLMLRGWAIADPVLMMAQARASLSRDRAAAPSRSSPAVVSSAQTLGKTNGMA